MKNDIKMVAYAERDSHGSRGDKTLTHEEGRRTQGGWRSNCMRQPGGIRERRGGCAHHSTGMDDADCIAEPFVLVKNHCILP